MKQEWASMSVIEAHPLDLDNGMDTSWTRATKLLSFFTFRQAAIDASIQANALMIRSSTKDSAA
jgi:predicted nuclease with RNAse H fold